MESLLPHIISLVTGGAGGWASNALLKNGMSLVSSLLLGVGGGLAGNTLGNMAGLGDMLGGMAGSTGSNVILSLVGSLLTNWIGGMMSKKA